MSEHHTSEEPVADNLIVTLVVFAYNQERFIEDACRAALEQTYSPLEIIFSDDYSSDQTFELIKSVTKNYCGPHQIVLNRNPHNFGLIGHVNKLFEMSSGDLIVVAAGDDISLPDRVECLADAFNQSERKALVIHSCATKINDLNIDIGIFVPPVAGRIMTNNELADSGSLYIGATAAWNKVLYNEFGPIVFKDAYEDLVFGFRALIKNSLVYVDKPLVRYREGVGISTHAEHPILAFRSRMAIRRKKLKIFLDVYEQRLKDLGCIEQHVKDNSLQDRLIMNINLYKKRLLFYQKPFVLLFLFFSKEFIIVLRAFKSEIKCLIGINV